MEGNLSVFQFVCFWFINVREQVQRTYKSSSVTHEVSNRITIRSFSSAFIAYSLDFPLFLGQLAYCSVALSNQL